MDQGHARRVRYEGGVGVHQQEWQHYCPEQLVFIDETHISRRDVRRRRGRAGPGRRPVLHDFFPGKVYKLSLRAACACHGFIGGACRVLDHADAGEASPRPPRLPLPNGWTTSSSPS